MTSARPYAGFSVSTIGVVVALWFAIIHVFSFAAGGYLAGRLRSRSGGSDEERQFRDGAHGFLVWAVGALVSVIVVSMGATAVVRGATQAGAAVATGAAAVTGAAAAGVSQSPTAQSAVQNMIGYATDMMLRPPTSPAGAASPTPPVKAEPPDATTTAEMGRILAMSVANDAISTDDRQYLARLISSRTGMSQGDADRRVGEVWDRYKAMRAEAETKARDAAETTRKSSVMAAFVTAAVSLAALVAAVLFAGLGSEHRDQNRTIRVFGQSRFW